MQLPNLLLDPHPLHPLPPCPRPSPSSSSSPYPSRTSSRTTPNSPFPPHPIISPHSRTLPPRGLLLADHRLPRHAVEDVRALRGQPFEVGGYFGGGEVGGGLAGVGFLTLGAPAGVEELDLGVLVRGWVLGILGVGGGKGRGGAGGKEEGERRGKGGRRLTFHVLV